MAVVSVFANEPSVMAVSEPSVSEVLVVTGGVISAVKSFDAVVVGPLPTSSVALA